MKLLTLVALVALAPLVPASHDPEACPGTTLPASAMIEVGDRETVFYLDTDEAGDVVIYEETNGIYDAGAASHDNLQRSAAGPFGVDACPHVDPHVDPDTKHADSGWA